MRRTKINWDAIRKAVEGGEIMKDVAKRFAVGTQSIRSKAQKEQWATPYRVKMQLKELQNAGIISADSPSQSGVVEKSELSPPSVTEKDTDQQQITQERVPTDPRIGYAEAVAYHVAKKVQQALPTLPTPKTWRDVNTADSMARRALGLDKQTVKAAGMFSFGDTQGAVAMQIEVVESQPEEADNGWFDGQD